MAAGTDVSALYDRWSDTYDSDANRTRDLAGVVLSRELHELAGGDVVELGCGTGRNTARLLETARGVMALDFSPGMLEKARARTASERVRFLQHDIRAPLPLAAACADLVVITLVLEHVEDLRPVFRECARVLRPGGALFVCELHPYRQWAGARPRFTDPATGERTSVPAQLHTVPEFVNHAITTGMRPLRLNEWRDRADARDGSPPRLLSLLYRRES